MTGVAENAPPTFLLQFQEEHYPSPDVSVQCGTQTRTETIESSDQDPQGLAPMLMGTLTSTQTSESSDQDPQVLAATASHTLTIEEPDQDPSPLSYYAVPRAICSWS